MHTATTFAVQLILDVADGKGTVTEGEAIELIATYVANAPTTIYHRMLMGWAPDELELIVEGAQGQSVRPRVALSLPKSFEARPEDFMAIDPQHPLRFAFPLWGDAPLPPGKYTVRARRPSGSAGGPDGYLDELGHMHMQVSDRRELVSNPVTLIVLAAP